MRNYKYKLNSRAGKVDCPSCGGKKSLTRYTHKETNAIAPDHFGACDHVNSCGYIQYPKGNFEPIAWAKPRRIQIDYTPDQVMRATFTNNHKLFEFMKGKYGEENTKMAFSKYNVGSSNIWPGSTVFWWVDRENKIRGGKVILYGKDGHRVKKPYSHTTWMHAKQDYNFDLCLYGEHLIDTYRDAVIAICESEKTAVMCSIVYPHMLWIACGSRDNLNPDNPGRLTPLKNRKIVLFPDSKAIDKWNEKAEPLSKLLNSKITVFQGTLAEDEDLDIADYI